MEKKIIKIQERDNVAVACRDLELGDEVKDEGREIQVLENIPSGHKIALSDILEGKEIIKYGHRIGIAVQNIKKGEWIHTHNMVTELKGITAYEYKPAAVQGVTELPEDLIFEGYVRQDGNIGTRNEIWVIPTVSCVNSTVQLIAQKAREYIRREFQVLSKYCDGICAFPHNAGCSQLGEDHIRTQKILANIVHHPNAGGVLLVSLGCENNNLEQFLPVLGDINPARIKTMVCQEVVGDEVEYGVQRVCEILREMRGDRRESVPAGLLKIGFKCGSSDAFSGITANPLCGYIADWVTGAGGTAILTEVPEMFGAEMILMERCKDKVSFEKVVSMINDFKQYYMGYGQPIYENPSPGNKAGGITTLEEKSLGCIQKGGSAVVTDTLEYGGICREAGLNLMTGPGNDSVSVTDLLSAGAQIILFTTGGGNPLGTAVPTMKISSNTALFEKKQHWIDFDAGGLAEGGDFKQAAAELWKMVLETASGRRRTKSEQHGYRDIMIFKDGVML